jgi:hypothetical protein
LARAAYRAARSAARVSAYCAWARGVGVSRGLVWRRRAGRRRAGRRRAECRRAERGRKWVSSRHRGLSRAMVLTLDPNAQHHL